MKILKKVCQIRIVLIRPFSYCARAIGYFYERLLSPALSSIRMEERESIGRPDNGRAIVLEITVYECFLISKQRRKGAAAFSLGIASKTFPCCFMIRRIVQKRRIFFISLAIVILATLAWVSFRTREPSYQGKTLTAWLEQRQTNSISTRPERVHAAENAIQQIGTNGIPLLLKFAESKDTPFGIKLFECADWINQKQGFIHLRLRAAEKRHFLAMAGFLALRSQAEPAVPALIELLKNSDFKVREVAMIGLISVGPAGKPALPALRRCLNDSDSSIRRIAAAIIKELNTESAAKPGTQ